jgi:hypothetical protein
MFQFGLNKIGRFLNSKSDYNEGFLKEHKLYKNIGFPPSYVDFVTTFGWGRLCGLYLIYVPLLNNEFPDSWEVQSKKVKSWMDDFYSVTGTNYDFLFEPDGTSELVKNAVPFAMSENGDYLIWDVENPDERGELPIYQITPRFSGIIYCGRDLLEAINSIVDKYYGNDTPMDFEVAKTFEPFVFGGD